MKLMPCAGLDYIMVEGKNYAAKTDGEKAFNYRPGSADLPEVPLGFAVSGKYESGDRTWKPRADISVIPVIGSRKLHTGVSGVSITATDTVNAVFTDSLRKQVQLGVTGNRKGRAFGAAYEGKFSNPAGEHAARFSFRTVFQGA